MPRDDDLFVEALEIPEAERDAFLAQHAGDPVQVSRVAALLCGHVRAPACFDRPGVIPLYDEMAGTIVDRYRLVERLGEGGCGIVWIAEQNEPMQRRVALKVIKLGMDTKEVVARFVAERQALALMEHPNIAKVFDAGATETGRPFFVMELVDGIPITRYCDDARLPVRDRLRLFIAVCHAVGHAHQKGIVHRDLKPSNILVEQHDGTPRPKVIDFGIAKATHGRVSADAAITTFAQLIGTPAYMSPEQVAGLDLDTRSDLYSLGTLLYELLTGRPPIDPKTLQQAGLDEMRRIIGEVEPARPSKRLDALDAAARGALAHTRGTTSTQLAIQLAGDLDCIVMKALEKDRTRRYETANAFALDLQRHLAHEPVLARPPSRGYLLQKFIRRHRAGFASTLAIALVLAAGATASTWQAVRATRAEREQSRLRAMESELRQSAEAQALAMRRRAYASDVNLAQRSLAEGDLGRVQELLQRHRPGPGEVDVRGWEWRHLWGRTRGQELDSLRFESGPPSCVVFSPDGNLVATGGYQQPVQLWITATRAPLASLEPPGRKMQPNSLSFSPNGRWLAASAHGTVVVWSTANWQVQARIPVVERTDWSAPVVFSPDGTVLAMLSGHEIQFWDTRDWEKRATIAPGQIAHGIFCLSEDWSFLALGGAQCTEIWDRAAARKVAEIPGWAVALRFSPDGRRLAVGNYEGTVLVWDTLTQGEIGRWKAHRSAVRGICFSPDGTLLATGGEDRAIHLWDAATLQPRASRLGHQQPVCGLSFSPDGRMLTSVSGDGTVRFWSTADAEPGAPLRGSATPLWFSPDGQTFATVSDGSSLQYWSTTSERVIRTVPLPAGDDQPLRIRMAADGKTVARPRPDGAIELWDAETQHRIATLPGETAQAVEVVEFSPDQRWLAVIHARSQSSRSHAGFMWDIANRRVVARFQAGRTALAFSPDGRHLATVHRDAIRILDTTRLPSGDAATLRTFGPAGTPNALVFSPDGRLLAAGGRAFAARIWEFTSGRHLADTTAQLGGVFAVAFAPDGKTLVTGSVDGTARFWETLQWQELMTVSEHGRAVGRLMFSPDGETLAVGSAQVDDHRGPVRLWRANLSEP